MKKLILPIAVLSLLLAAACTRPPVSQHTANQPEPAPAGSTGSKGELVLAAQAQAQAGIESIVASPRSTPEIVTANGTLTPNEDRTWMVSSYVLGRVADVKVKIGDLVTPGQVLARMHSHEVHDSRASYQQSLAALTEAETQGSLTRKARDRAQRLFALQVISRGQLEQAQADHEKAQALVDSAQAAVQREKTHLAEVLQVPLQPDGTERSDLVPVTAPARGVLFERQVSAGTVVNPGSLMFRIADLSTLWLIASVNESDLSKIYVGQPVEMHVRAYPQRTFHGVTSWLGESLDPTTRTLQVRVSVPNRDEALKPEMYATVAFQGRHSRPAIAIPESALQDLNGQHVVFLQTSATSFRPQVVVPGPASNGVVEIASGLQAGDRVVIRGGYGLKSEMLKASLSEGN